MAVISSFGIGSGLEIRSLVDQLVSAETQPAINRINIKEANLQAKLSALDTLKSALSGCPYPGTRLSQALVMSQQMLKAARNKEWQRLSELEASQRNLLSTLFEGSSKASEEVLDETVLVRIYDINQQVLDLVKLTRDMTQKKIRGLGAGRKAIRAYVENKPLF
jgi:hypothetical protein